MTSAGLTLENDVFSKFAFYASVVLLKTILMSIWTIRFRIPRNVFSSPEDYGLTDGKVKTTTDPDIERVRRCHLNDLENVLPFILIGLLYVLTGPDAFTAAVLFRVFAVSRVLHTFAYVLVIPQPARLLCWMSGYIVNVIMVITVLMTVSC